MKKHYTIPLPKSVEVDVNQAINPNTGLVTVFVTANFAPLDDEPAPVIVNDSPHVGPWLHVNTARGEFFAQYYKKNKSKCIRQVIDKLVSDFLGNCEKMFLPSK
jgi:hypothetical protein